MTSSSTGDSDETGFDPNDRSLKLGEMFDTNQRWLKGLGLPSLIKPVGLGAEYSFPTDLSLLQSHQLGDLSLKLTAYYTYALQLLGREDGELGAIEAVYDIKLGLAMDAEAGRRVGASPVKDILRALAIENDENVKRLHRSILVRTHRKKLLEVQSSIYHEQLTRLSREQSRREGETRVAR